MGDYIKTDNIVLLLDNYMIDGQNLHTSFKLAGKNYPTVVIDDDGFLPDDVISVFGYFLGAFNVGENVPGKPRYFNQIKVPEYWEISGNNNGGKIHNLNMERGRIFYAEPKNKRLVKVVDWYDEKGVVRSSDHYNKHGALYARTIFNAEGKKVNKTYFSASGAEIIMENYVTHDIILNDGDIVRIFPSKTDFVLFFMERAGYAEHRVFFNTLSTSFFVSQRLSTNRRDDVLFWQEPIKGEIPGNMRIILEGNAKRATKIMVQRKASYNRLLELGVSNELVHKLGYIYSFKKDNMHRPEALICTNSDKIAQCQKLVETFPQMHFHIAALTEMSSKLTSMDRYSNVSLYPGVKASILDELFMKCDYYLDINYGPEIVSAVERAFLHNHLIFAFKDTMHNSNYVVPEHIYQSDSVEKMCADIRQVMSNRERMQIHLQKQHEYALSEVPNAYLNI